jgi:hypothetical protein
MPFASMGKEKAELIGDKTKEPKGYIIFLDEINRAHEDIRQAMNQFLVSKKMHTYEAPENTFIIAAANPASKYECYEFDGALVNKFAWIKFKPDVAETLKYLDSKHGNSLMLAWLSGQSGLVNLGDNDFEVTDLRLTPRIVENGVLLYEELKNESDMFMQKALETIMPLDELTAFMAFLEEVKHINYVDVMNGVKMDKIESLVKSKNLGVLTAIGNDLSLVVAKYDVGGDVTLKEFVSGKVPLTVTEEEAVINIGKFFNAVNPELLTSFMDKITLKYNKVTCLVSAPEFKAVVRDKMIKFKDVTEAMMNEKATKK